MFTTTTHASSTALDRNSVPTATCQSLVVASVMPRLDHRNSMPSDWFANTPSMPPQVGAERTCMVDLLTLMLQSYNRRTSQLSLAKRSGTHSLQESFCLESHGSIFDLLFVSPNCLVNKLSALQALTAWCCHPSYFHQAAVEPSGLPVLKLGIVCQQILHWQFGIIAVNLCQW